MRLRDLGLLGVCGMGASAAFGERLQERGEALEWKSRDLGDVIAGELHGKRLGAKALAVADIALGGEHVLRDALFHQRAVRVREGRQDMALCAGERAHIAGLQLALEGLSGFGGSESGVDGNLGLVFGEEDPVAVLLRQITPWLVDVIAERDQDVALVLTSPRGRPCCDGTLDES